MELKFPITPEFDQTVIIQPDGYINLLQVGDLHVEGKTTSELIEGIRVAYRKLLHEPEITVKLLEFEKPYFVAGGEVGKPGRYDMRGDMTVAQAVNVAGGFTTAAKHSQVLLFRRVSDEWVRVIELDLKKMFNKADLTEDLHLQPGDMVFVPKSRMAKIKEYIPKAMVPSVRF
jgi:polysaccharide export outer membrane protein